MYKKVLHLLHQKSASTDVGAGWEGGGVGGVVEAGRGWMKAQRLIFRPPHGPHCPWDCDGGGLPFPSDDVDLHGDVVSGRAVHLGGATVLCWQCLPSRE